MRHYFVYKKMAPPIIVAEDKGARQLRAIDLSDFLSNSRNCTDGQCTFGTGLVKRFLVYLTQESYFNIFSVLTVTRAANYHAFRLCLTPSHCDFFI